MPFLGQDWRGPGCNWSKVDCSKWEEQEPSIGVLHDPIPRNHVKKIIEAFLRQMQQKKNRSLYTNMTSAPVSKCSVREEMVWLQVGLKGSKEIHGYSTLGEVIRRLDLAGAARISHRFPYILDITELLIQKKLGNLSGSAQSHLFELIEALLQQVLETRREIRRMHQLLNRLMTNLQHQSKKHLFTSKTSWFESIAIVRKWQRELKLISIPQRVDHHATLPDLPIELQRQIVSCLSDYDDIKSVSQVNTTLHFLTEEASMWRQLCFNNYTQEQINEAKSMILKKTIRQTKERLKFGRPLPAESKHNYLNPTTTEEWKNIHNWLHRSFQPKDKEYIDPLLFCRRCSILFWEASGHPCINEVQNALPEIDRLTPRRVIGFFE